MDGSLYQGYKSCVYRTFCCGKATQEQKDLYEECRAMLYDGLSVIKDGATDHEVLAKWPQSPQYWGYETWQEVGPYALGHGLGLTLHDRPFFNQQQKEAGLERQTFREGMVLAALSLGVKPSRPNIWGGKIPDPENPILSNWENIFLRRG